MTPRKPFFRPRLAFSAARDARAAEEDRARQFRELVLPHLDGAYNFARYLTRDATAAEDIVQDAFLRAFKAFPTYRGARHDIRAPKAWLFAIVRNCFLTWAGSRSTRDEVLLDDSALANIPDLEQETPEAALIRRRDAEAIRAVIENLPEPFRETLVLREMEELSYREIAALTAAPIGTVMSRLARARQMLGEMLAPEALADGVVALRETKR